MAKVFILFVVLVNILVIRAAGPCLINQYLDVNNNCVNCDASRSAPVASTTIAACICPANKYGAADNTACLTCSSGKKSAAGSKAVTDCKSYSNLIKLSIFGLIAIVLL